MLNERSQELSVEESVQSRHVDIELYTLPRLHVAGTMPTLREDIPDEIQDADSRADISEVELAVHDISSKLPVYVDKLADEPRVRAQKAEPLFRQHTEQNSNLSTIDSSTIGYSIGAEKDKIKGSILTM